MRQNPHVRICGGPGSATTLVYPTGPTAWADRESCHAHVGMGAWVGQHRGGVHACLTPAGVEHLDRH